MVEKWLDLAETGRRYAGPFLIGAVDNFDDLRNPLALSPQRGLCFQKEGSVS
jgi:hypothetical protein